MIRALGRTSSVPERWGVDLLVPSLRLGVQRKEVSDFVASLTGDRLAKEVQQMRRLQYRVLVLEGRWAWNADGQWAQGYQRFTIDQLEGALLSLQMEGVMVLQSRDMRDTVRCIGHLVSWAGKESHTALSSRPKYLMSQWGTRDNEDWQVWLVQGFERVGPKVAKAIVRTFGGAPLQWTVSETELRGVPGVGKVMARRLIGALADKKARG